MEVARGDIVLCRFFFSDLLTSKNRPVLVFKDNLPFNDFVAIPVSSRIQELHKDEIEIGPEHFIQGGIPKRSKLMLRKTFVVSKDVVLKKYGTLNNTMFKHCQESFCNYFDC